MRPIMLGLGGMLLAGWLALAGSTVAWADSVDLMDQMFHQDITAEELAAINAAFPEGSGLNPDFIAAANNPNLHLYQQATVTFTFLGEGAGFKNTVGYFLFDDNGNILDMRTIFSNASAIGAGGSLEIGDSVVLGVFDAGTNLGFWLRADGYNNPSGKVYYTLEGLNPDQKRHYALWMDNANQQAVYGVEDLWNLGDGDYNDLLYSVSADPYSAINPSAAAPEPASLLLVISGLAGLAGAGWRVRRRS